MISNFESSELDLLETLSGGQTAYSYIEKMVFDQDRDHALRSMMLMRAEGLISMSLDGAPILEWQIQAWRRTSCSPETEAALAHMRIWITSAGTRWYWLGAR